MQLSVTLAILGALLAADAAPGEPLSNVAQRTLLCTLLVALVVVAARMVASATAMGLQSRPGMVSVWPARYRRLRALHGLALVATVAAIYLGLGWPQIVRANWQLKGCFVVDEILILLPVLLALAFSWWALGTAEQALEDCHAARQGRSPRAVGGVSGAMSLVRHVMVPALAPLLLVLAAQDVIDWLTPQGTPATLATCLIAAGAVLGYPWLLRCIWRTEPLADGALRTQLRTVEQRMGVRVGEILMWNTGGTICNAAVAGIWPGCRYVFLSDVLLARLQPEEVAAIYAHELGHVRHRHLLLRLLAVLLPVVAWHALAATFPGMGAAASVPLAGLGMSAALPTALLTLLVATIYAATLFSWYCRALEHQADLCGCQSSAAPPDDDGVSDSGEGAEPFVTALAALSILTQSRRQATKSTWLHPATTRRIALVRQMAAAPQQRQQFARRMRRLAWLLLALVAGLAAWPLVLELLGRL